MYICKVYASPPPPPPEFGTVGYNHMTLKEAAKAQCSRYATSPVTMVTIEQPIAPADDCVVTSAVGASVDDDAMATTERKRIRGIQIASRRKQTMQCDSRERVISNLRLVKKDKTK